MFSSIPDYNAVFELLMLWSGCSEISSRELSGVKSSVADALETVILSLHRTLQLTKYLWKFLLRLDDSSQ